MANNRHSNVKNIQDIFQAISKFLSWVTQLREFKAY